MFLELLPVSLSCSWESLTICSEQFLVGLPNVCFEVYTLSWIQVTFPVRQGGLGIRSAPQTSTTAFHSS